MDKDITLIDSNDIKKYKVAEPWKRTISFILDTVIIFPIYMLLIYISSDTFLDNEIMAKGIYNFLFLFLIFSMWIVFKGQTLGQMILKLKIVSMDNKDLTVGKYLLRLIGYLACNITFGIGFLVMFINKDKRGLHDLTSNSKVIDLNNEE